MLFGNFSVLQMPNIKQIIQQSGHTVHVQCNTTHIYVCSSANSIISIRFFSVPASQSPLVPLPFDPVWPIGINFATLAKSFLCKYLSVNLIFGIVLNLLWQIIYDHGQLFIEQNGLIFKNNIATWSHCFDPKCYFGFSCVSVGYTFLNTN